MEATQTSTVELDFFSVETDFDEPMTAQEAAEAIAVMRQEVESVPSYVEVQALTAWLENGKEEG